MKARRRSLKATALTAILWGFVASAHAVEKPELEALAERNRFTSADQVLMGPRAAAGESEEEQVSLLEVRPKHSVVFTIACFAGTFLIRAILCVFYALSRRGSSPHLPDEPREAFGAVWWHAFLGRGLRPGGGEDKDDVGENDYMTAAVMGFLELLSFPMLIVSGNAEYIGGWLLLKTLSRWEGWERRRGFYNRFLLGNGLVVVASYFAARFMF